ncbi:hypothetical protein POM88_054968 [Heracleum sosnowskyi]|uniref:Uncharacterized protein n=1 Tax=Heracleum sosnowskyi TaxID=360622 RepID=A0AAD8LW29_9APIA|nr:hypothetical protein POM88_054967 [Heracleum sosnowskyi]KAK1348250.1 hypothetical protein POM88_054968 [Heracleum sosnowskyi]
MAMAMAMRKCLGRVMRGGVCNQSKSKSLFNCYYAAATNWFNNNNIYTPFSSENPKSIYNKVPEDVKGGSHFGPLLLTKNYTTKVEPDDKLQLIGIKEGEFVNIFDLLFTETRDYLIKCNDGQQVKDEELAGKVVIIYFDSVLDLDTGFMEYLIHTYNSLQHKSGFEVVFVNVDDAVDILNAARQPSLKALLASPERDYLISNKGDKVPIHTLEDMVCFWWKIWVPGFILSARW